MSNNLPVSRPSLHVAIVGAGPAGSSAAMCLARAGARVTVLERATFPRDKVCGDGCTPRTLWMLERLGCDGPSLDGAADVTSFFLGSPGGHGVHAPLPEHVFGGRGLVVPRAVLDAELARLAVEAGAEIREGVYVTSISADSRGVDVRLRGGDEVKADVVLGCDGDPSVVRKSLGAPAFPDAHRGVALRVYYEGVSLSRPDTFALYWERELLPAYGWVFPLPGGRANVGVGMRRDQLERHGATLRELLDRFCAQERVAPELEGGRRTGPPKGHHIPAGSFESPVVFDRALLLGDAAGFVNPLTGEGIEFALESGELAAEAVLDGHRRGDLSESGLAPYAAACDARFRRTFRATHRLQKWFERPWIADRLIRAADGSPKVCGRLAEVMLGETPGVGWRLAVAGLLGV